MNNPSTKRTFHNIVHQSFDRPRVRLFMDLTDFDSRVLISLFDDVATLVKVMSRYARSFGSLVDQKVVRPIEQEEEVTYGDMLRPISQELRSFIDSGPSMPCIYMLVGTHPYLYIDAPELLATKGHVVVVVGKETREDSQVIDHDLVYYLNAAKLADRGEKPDSENYDFGPFIQLMLYHENRMAFVSAKYFVTKQMWRLGSQNPEINQRVFQAARDRGIIELGKSENVDASAPQVTTCKLNREHSLVAAELANSQDSGDSDYQPLQGLKHRMDLSVVKDLSADPSPG